MSQFDIVGGHRCERITLVRYSPPCITARRGGCVVKKCCEATEADAAGVVFLLFSIGKPPRPRDQRMLRGILLIARPPLLAVMQGGECARFPLFVYWSSLSLPSPHAARTWRMDPATARFRKADSFRTQARLARCLQELFLKSGSGTYIS